MRAYAQSTLVLHAEWCLHAHGGGGRLRYSCVARMMLMRSCIIALRIA